MCLAIPGCVMEIEADTARVDFGGVRRRIGIGLVPEVKLGDYVLVHAGFAIQIVDQEEAGRQLDLIRQLLDAEEEAAGDKDE